MIKKRYPRKYRCFSRLWQQGLNFADLPLLGSCTYPHSYCPGAPDAHVKYVTHRASFQTDIFSIGTTTSRPGLLSTKTKSDSLVHSTEVNSGLDIDSGSWIYFEVSLFHYNHSKFNPTPWDGFVLYFSPFCSSFIDMKRAKYLLQLYVRKTLKICQIVVHFKVWCDPQI